MFPSLSFLYSSLFLLTAALPVESTSSTLLQLTAANFTTSTSQGAWFVEFYSPSCGHCKHFAPTWQELVEHFQSQKNPGIRLARVNCVIDGDLCNDLQMKGYPSLRIFQDGKQLDEFGDDREFDILVEYVTKYARVPEVLLNPDGVVLSLDKDTFQATIDQGPAFVKFFVPWCGHCKKLAPTWVQFAARMKNKVTVAEVNCDNHNSFCTKQNLKGYPTIYFYQHGRTHEYMGRRTLETLESFIDTALAPPLTKISAPELTTVLGRQDVLFILVHDELDPTIRDNVEEASQPFHGSPQIFSIETSPDLLASLSLPASQSLPALVSLKDHSMVAHRHLVVSAKSTVQEISDWLIRHSLPTSTELDAENFQNVMGPSPVSPGSPSRLIVLGAVNTRNSAHVNVIKQAAITWHRDEREADDRQVVFAWMDKDKWANWLKSVYGIKKDADFTVVIVDHARLLYYDSFPAGEPIDLNTSSIFAALKGVLGGALRPKHSENIVERFARWVSDTMLAFQSAVFRHPMWSALFLIVAIIGIFIGIKRVLEADTRKSSVYINSKSGARLD